MKLVSNQTAAIVAIIFIILLIIIPQLAAILGILLFLLVLHDWWSKITPISLFNQPNLHSTDDPHDASQLSVFMYMKHNYLGSNDWFTKRLSTLQNHNFQCDVCQSTGQLEVHHLSGYCRIPHELPSDLAVLCRDCHQLQHTTHGYPKTYQDYMTWSTSLVRPSHV